MRTKKFIYNSSASASLSVITLLTGLILPRLYLTTYGSEVNGLISSILEFVSYFTYVEAGLGSSLIYALFRPLAVQDKDEINGIISLAKKSYIKISGLYFLLVACLSFLYPFIVKSSTINATTVALLVMVIGAFEGLNLLTTEKYRVLLTADQREYMISIVSIVVLVFNFVLVLILIKNKVYIVLVRAVPLVSFVLRSFLLHLFVKKKYPFIRYDQPPRGELLKNRWDALLFKLSTYICLLIPLVIISIVCSLKMASVYSIYNLVFHGLVAIISIFTAGISASFGNVLAKKEFAVLYEAYTQFEFSIHGITAFLFSCTLILISSFVGIYTYGVTDIAYVNFTYGILFVIWGILHNIPIPINELVNAAGLYRETRWLNITQIALLVVLSVIMAEYYQISGVLFAMIVSMIYKIGGLVIVAKQTVLKLPILKTITRIGRIFLVVALTYMPFIAWIRISAVNLIQWAAWAIGVSIWCGLATIAVNFALDRKTFIGTLCRFKALITKKDSEIVLSEAFRYYIS